MSHYASVLTREWGLTHPLLLAPMANVGGGRLAGAVTAAGGLGMIGIGSTAPVELVEEQAALARPSGPFGVGLMIWAVERRPELLDAALAAGPAVVSLSFGDPAPYVTRVHEVGARIVSQVQDRASAQGAVAAGIDAVVAQGGEAGGHTGSVATLPLVQEVLAVAEPAGVPVLAAGGIATGAGMAAMLAAGAAGVWVGTRFAVTVEALGAPDAKKRILAADDTETVHTRVFDIAQGLPWPPRYPGRALRNAFTERWHGQEEALRAHLEDAQATLRQARQDGDYDTAYVYAGQASGLVDDLPEAGALVDRIVSEAYDRLARAAARLNA